MGLNRITADMARVEAKRKPPQILISDERYRADMSAYHWRGKLDARGEMKRFVMLALAGGFVAGLLVGINW